MAAMSGEGTSVGSKSPGIQYARKRDRAVGVVTEAACPCFVVCGLLAYQTSQKMHHEEQKMKRWIGEKAYIVFEWIVYDASWVMMLHHGFVLLGSVFIASFLGAQLPYAIHDVQEGQWRRSVVAFIGLRRLYDYSGFTSAPEVELFTDVLGKLPMLIVTAMAAAEGKDVLVWFEDETDYSRFLTLVFIVVTGGAVSRSAHRCLDAARPQSVQVTDPLMRIERHVGSMIDGCLARVSSFVAHALDTVALVAVVSAVGLKFDHAHFVAWLASMWMLCGLVPALAAPPPLPTLRPAIPSGGIAWVLHRLLASVIIASFPPMEYMPVLDRHQQQIWACAVLLRTAWIMTTAVCVPSQLAVGPLGFIDFVFIAGVVNICMACLRLCFGKSAQSSSGPYAPLILA
mmetsp:Transcript_87964/g.247153  ORF Transcript_87964/g.247153 Transcript_87964/m.247153 type:complete len:399 (-) Transcript_87964:153-1349(-)